MISYETLFKTMKERGISSYRLQKMGFNRATYYSITVNLLCKLLHCQVENIIAYVEDEKE